jgi:hypothetical protein
MDISNEIIYLDIIILGCLEILKRMRDQGEDKHACYIPRVL